MCENFFKIIVFDAVSDSLYLIFNFVFEYIF